MVKKQLTTHNLEETGDDRGLEGDIQVDALIDGTKMPRKRTTVTIADTIDRHGFEVEDPEP